MLQCAQVVRPAAVRSPGRAVVGGERISTASMPTTSSSPAIPQRQFLGGHRGIRIRSGAGAHFLADPVGLDRPFHQVGHGLPVRQAATCADSSR